MRRPLVALALLFGACMSNPNPPVPPPSSAELSGGGAWVAYNLGCKLGCDQIKRGDRILAVDGKPVGTGAELDAILSRGTPVAVTVARHEGGPPAQVQLIGAPHTELTPIEAVPPLLTIGAAALDRAPEWARLRLFGHATPAMRLYRGDEPRGFINGRQLHGRGALIFVWELPWLLSMNQALWAELPGFYAQLQKHQAALHAAGVDVYFVFPSEQESRNRRPDSDAPVAMVMPGGDTLRFAINQETREHLRSEVPPNTPDLIPLYLLDSASNDPNNLGLEHAASDIREWLYDGILASVILVIDERGIVRFHSRDYPIGPEETIEAAVQFALQDLPDGPKRADAPAATPATVSPVPAPERGGEPTPGG